MDAFIILIYFALLIAFGILYYYHFCFDYWRRRNVQTLSPNFLFGNASDTIFGKVAFVDIFGKTYEEFKSKGCRYAGYYLFAKPILVVFDSKLIETILIKDFGHFADRPFYCNKKVDPLSENLISMRGSEWKNMRSILSPAFTSKKLKMMFGCFVAIGNNLKSVMDDVCENSKVIEIKDIANKYIIDIFGTSFLGIECNTLFNKDNDFSRLITKTLRGNALQNLKLFASFTFPSVINFLGRRLIDKETSDFYINITKQTVEYRESNNVVKKDLMQLLIQLRNHINIEENDDGDLSQIKSDKRDKLLSVEEIAAQVFALYGAGSESSSSTIAFCLFELIQNPKTEKKLTEEINRVLAKYNGEITYESLMDMAYMDMCIKEINRIYPTLPFLSRVCTKDWVIPGTDIVIQKGNYVQIPILQLHHDPEYFPNPEQFDPERFSSKNKSNIHPTTYLPFGDGPHMCIGTRIAFFQIKVALTILLKNYKFTLNPITKVPLEKNPRALFFAVKTGIWINVEKI